MHRLGGVRGYERIPESCSSAWAFLRPHVPFSKPSVGVQGLPPSTDIRNVVAEPDLVHRGDPFAIRPMGVSAAEHA